ncbi:MAG: EamA/RhaT family transporter, partial [Gluconobacter oxydans]
VGIVVVTLSGMLNWIRQKLHFERMALEEHWEHRHHQQTDVAKP